MAEILVTAFVEVLLEKLLSLTAKTLVSKLVGDGKKYGNILEEWRVELRMIKAVLADAEQKQCSREAVKTWLEQLQDVAFDIEDVLADFDIQVQAREFSKANASGVIGFAKNVLKRVSPFKPVNPRKIDEITDNMKRIQSQIPTLGLLEVHTPPAEAHTPPAEALRSQRESVSILSEQKILGRDEEKQKIVNHLLKDDESDKNYVMIPIVGNGGIGKTTLAQFVYNEEQLGGHFDLKAWVCVSDVFDAKCITTTIWKAAVGRGTVVDFSTLDEAQKKLKEDVMSKKFLIVLDDIWNEEYGDWDKLRIPFQYAVKGSRVIMTTRNMQIARMMNTDPRQNNIINLGGLSDNHCWRVFRQHANNDFDLAELRDDVIKKCKGLPLAAKTLGGLLRKKRDIKQCRTVLENDSWSNEENGILQVLRLSYYYLPSHLKCMFAYCSVLRKDYEFTEMEIIQLWMAQGFLPENQGSRMEDLGHAYFNDLRSSSLFEQSPHRKGRFIMHDFIHDLAQWAAGGNCYVMGTKDVTQVDCQRIRHVFFIEDGRTTLESQLPMASQLRTFYCDYHRYFQNLNFVNELRYIRTLRLASKTIQVLPECIVELQHLRFLSLRFQRMKELPTSIGNLWNLQTLSLKNCSMLERIPNISSLEKLRHLEIEDTSLKDMPIGFEKVTNLQSFDKLILGCGLGARIRELKDLNQLEGKLQICGLDNVLTVNNAREAQLYKKCRLDELYLQWVIGRNEVNDNTKKKVLEQLKPHSSIKRCNLDGYGGLAFPAWLGDPCFDNMVTISLIKCDKCECLPPLGQLPKLETLKIDGMDGIVQVGPEFYGNRRCSNPFPALKTLHFLGMRSWERWLPVDNDRAFPCLQSLEIILCHLLQGDVPPHLPSLKKLEIKYCKELRALIPLQSLPSLQVMEVENCKIQLITTSEGALKEENGLSPSPKGNTPWELPYLTTLEIKKCPSLKSFPDGLLLPALETLELIHCENMESLPSELPKYTSLQSLQVLESPKIQCFPDGGLPKNLKTLKIRGLNLKSISCSTIPNLTNLAIEDCRQLKSFEDDALPPQLRSLCIKICPRLQFFLQQGCLPKNLKQLEIIDVKVNQAIQAWDLHYLHSLQCFTLREVDTEEDLSLPSSLSEINIKVNRNVKNLSVVDGTTPLTRLIVEDCPNLESVVGNFTSLSRLFLWKCPKLQYLPEVGLLLNLKGLEISGVSIEKPIREWGLHLLSSLQHLQLRNIGSCTDAVECILDPDGLELPSSLYRLEIGGFQNLKSIRCSTLPNLTCLKIEFCPQFESFADNILPPYVEIKECDSLKPRLKRDPDGRILINYGRWSLCQKS